MVQGVYQLQPVPAGSDGMVLTIDLDGERKRILLGEPGDQLVLGDWDCDGVDTPGLYKAAAGEVQYFDVWPDGGRSRTSRTRSRRSSAGGRAELAEGDGSRCDRISVDARAGVVGPCRRRPTPRSEGATSHAARGWAMI